MHEYEKNRNNYANLKDKIATALDNAEWLHKQIVNDVKSGLKPYELQAYTSVNELIDFLEKLK